MQGKPFFLHFLRATDLAFSRNRGRFPAMVRGQTGAFPTVKERLCKCV